LRDKQIEYTRLITQSDPHNASGSQYYRPFWELTRLSLEYTLDRLKFERGSGQVEKLMQQYAHLTAFPENLAVLQKIKSMGLTTALSSRHILNGQELHDLQPAFKDIDFQKKINQCSILVWRDKPSMKKRVA
jgi:hypothetical protein